MALLLLNRRGVFSLPIMTLPHMDSSGEGFPARSPKGKTTKGTRKTVNECFPSSLLFSMHFATAQFFPLVAQEYIIPTMGTGLVFQFLAD